MRHHARLTGHVGHRGHHRVVPEGTGRLGQLSPVRHHCDSPALGQRGGQLQARLGQLAPPLLRTGQALGMSPVQALLGVVFPAARRSLTTALVLGFCRAIGDTLVALMVAGNAPQLPDSLLDSVRTLTAHIALVLATDSFSPEYRSISAAASSSLISSNSISSSTESSMTVDA